MPNTALLNLEHIAAGTLHPSDPYNETLNELDEILAGELIHEMTSDADYTLGTTGHPAEWQVRRIEITDSPATLTATRNIVFPDQGGVWAVKNSTAEALTFKPATGSGVTVQSLGMATIMINDAGNMIRIDDLNAALVSVNEVSDANITGIPGVMHLVDTTAFTAPRDFVLPTAANTNDRIGIACKLFEPAHHIALKSGASGDLINGTDHSATEWSRLFQAGEVVIFRCIDGTSVDWLVEYDGRIPCSFGATMTTDVTAETANTWTHIPFNTIGNGGHDNGGVFDTTTDERLEVRRAGVWHLSVAIKPVTAPLDGKLYGAEFHDGTNGITGAWHVVGAAPTVGVAVSISHVINLAATATVEARFFSEDGSRGVDAAWPATADNGRSRFGGVELL